jgi:DNA-binding NtrC family response regulator
MSLDEPIEQEWWRVDDIDPYAISAIAEPILVLEQGAVASISEGVQALFLSTEVLDWVGVGVRDVKPASVSACLSALWHAFVRGAIEPARTFRLESKLIVAQLWRLDRKGGPTSSVVSLIDLSAQIRAKEVSVRRAVKRMAGQAEATSSRLQGLQLIGNCPSLRQAWKRLRQVAPLELPVLLCGETGTGKSVAASTLHALSARRDRPLQTVACASAAPEDLPRLLFGEVRDPLSGTSQDQKGAFESVRGGSLFLDEIAELGLSAQAKLLNVLETGRVRPLNSSRDVAVDVRLIAATNRDLWEEVGAGRFREDLYYRVRVFDVELPPLRQRGDDVQLLAHHFVQQIAGEQGRTRADIAPDAMRRLMNHEWPGNVRQLRNAIQSALVSAGDTIQVSDLPPDVLPSSASPGRNTMTRERIEAALRESGGKRVLAARILGVSRVTLWKWIKRLDVEIEH